MIDFLRKIRLYEDIKVEMPINKSDFVNTLRSNVDAPQADFLDIFSGGKNLYKGKVSYEGFELKRKKKIFEMSNMFMTKATGKLTQIGDKLIIDIGMNGFYYLFIPFFILGPIFYGVFVVAMLTGEMKNNMGPFSILFVLLHATFMFGIPYLLMRRGLRSAKYELERDLHFMMKDKFNNIYLSEY